MIRVLHIVAGMNRGGIETFIMNIYRKIDIKKVQFDFLVHTNEECAYDQEIKDLGGKIYSVPSRKKGLIKNYKALNTFFKNHSEYKIIHHHLSSLTYVAPLKIASKYNVPVRIVHSHNTKQGGHWLHKYIHKINQLFVKSFATDYFACSDLAAKWLYPNNIYKKNKFEIINNAIDTDDFVFNENSRNLKRKEFNLKDEFVIGHVGRFHPQKNHNFLIDIFKYINDRNKETKLLLIGDGNLRSDIKIKAKKLNLKDDVIFTGVRSDIPDLLNLMDVFVMPSHHEGLPVTLVEAQAAGLPCVLSNNITNEVEIIDNVDWCDLDDNLSVWSEKILKYKSTNIKRDTRKEIIEAGFDTKHVADELMKFYLKKYDFKI